MLCLFYSCPPRFRAWTGGGVRGAGSWQGDGIREIVGNLAFIHSYGDFQLPAGSGALSWGESGNNRFALDTSGKAVQGISFAASRVVPTSDENRPANVTLPVCMYLGLPA